jgi:hypothetical protein
MYQSPHNQQAAAHQREVDRRDVREMARELFAADALKTLEAIAEPLGDALPSEMISRLEKILLDAADRIADQRISQLERMQ